MARAEPRSHLSGFERWKQGIDQADKEWDSHDAQVKSTVQDYAQHLHATAPGYSGLDWRLVKSMLWVETGAKDPAWKVRPMQIGSPHDPGLGALLGKTEGGWLILPPSYRLSESAVRSIARENIKAGVGYLLMKMANFAVRTVMDADSRTYEVSVAAGDSLDRVARLNGSTVDVLLGLNPAAGRSLRPGQVLSFKKASTRKVIAGWKYFDVTNIALYYNGGGDSLYAKKLRYAWEAVRKGTRL